jgi:16S rRNA processing protein RimM
MNDAEKLKDNYILIDRRNAIKLPEGSYFICDLIGLEVYDIDRGCLGEVVDVISTGSDDVYVTHMGDSDVLIPALKTVVREINIEEGRMTVHLPEGLI